MLGMLWHAHTAGHETRQHHVEHAQVTAGHSHQAEEIKVGVIAPGRRQSAGQEVAGELKAGQLRKGCIGAPVVGQWPIDASIGQR